VRLELGQPTPERLQLGLERLEPLPAARILFLPERLPLDLEPLRRPVNLVDLDRHRVDLHPKARARLVDQIDRLVR
jgi:hypothetical protein